MQTARRTLIIGLGGIGVRSALSIKRALYQFYGVTPLSVKIAVFDTTHTDKSLRTTSKTGRKESIRLDDKEFIYLPVSDPDGVIRSTPSIQEWWPQGLPTRAIHNGAGAFRALGRLALHTHADIILKKLDRLTTQLYSAKLGNDMLNEQGIQLKGGGIDVYIMGSLAGGTGSGCFLDMAFIIKQLTIGQSCSVYGYLVMPWIFHGLPATPRIEINAYSALKELDHYMGLVYPLNAPVFTFGKKEIIATSAPFDVVNLIDGRNESNQNVKDIGSDIGIDNLCDLIGTGLTLNMSSTGQAFRNVTDNIVAQNPADWGGKHPHYCSFGVSSVVYPMEKHYNRAANGYALLLLEDGLRIAHREEEDATTAEAEQQVNSYIVEAKLTDESGEITDTLVDQSEFNVVIRLPRSLPSFDRVIEIKNDHFARVERELRIKLNGNLANRKEEAQASIRNKLQSIEEANGPAHALAFSNLLKGRLEAFKEKRIKQHEDKGRDHKQLEQDLKDSQIRADEISALKGTILRRKKAYYQDYLTKARRVLESKIEISVIDAAIEYLGFAVDTITEYQNQLQLPDIARKLSVTRERIYGDLFRTSILEKVYGEYALMIEPLRIWVRSDKGPNTGVRVGIGEMDGGTAETSVGFAEFLEQRGIKIDFNVFLRDQKFTSIGDLNKLSEDELTQKFMSYGQKRLSFVTELTLEDILVLGVETDTKRQEILGRTLEEASNRAQAMWYHHAVGGMANAMEEVFILGVQDVEHSKLTGVAAEPYLPKTKYTPTFASTGDPWKLYCFKYKNPLPAYLLHGMEEHRKEYESIPVFMTPHGEKEIELRIPDIFPEVPESSLRVFTFAAVPSFGLISVQQQLKGGRYEEVYEMDGKELGRSRGNSLTAFAGLNDGKLTQKAKDMLIQMFKDNSDGINQELENHLDECKRKLEREKEKVRTGDSKESMTIGKEISLKTEIDVLGKYFESGGDLPKFLDLSE